MPTLPENTAPASDGERDLVVLENPDKLTPVHTTAAALEAQLEQAKTERKQERFIWIMTAIGLVDSLIVSHDPWTFTFVLPFSIIMLLVAARQCEVPWILTHLERMFEKTFGSKKPEETEETE